MSTTYYVISQRKESATVRLRQALSTVPLEGEVWLAGRLELRLGPPSMRMYPPSPHRLASSSVLKTGLNLDLTAPIFGSVLAVIAVVSLLIGYSLTTHAQQESIPTPESTVLSVPTLVLGGYAPMGAVQASVTNLPTTDTPQPTPTIRIVLPVPTQVPTIAPATETPIPPTATEPRRVVVPPTIAEPTSTDTPPTPTVAPSSTPWWPDLNGAPTPMRSNISPTPGSGPAGNDFSPSIFGRSSTIPAPTP